MPSSGNTLCKNVGSTKWRLHWGTLGRSNLRFSWDKCGVWLVGWWIHSLYVSLCFSDHSTLRILMWWFSMLVCYIHLRHWHADDIDRFWSYHDYPVHFDMYVRIIIYLVVLLIDSFAYILFWPSLSMLCYPCCYSSWLSYSHLAYVWT